MTTYTNPVYQHECADPYVFSFCGTFWCYATGFRKDGRVFGILRSDDLVHWEEAGSALDPLPEGYTQYWAPEVVYDNGLFYMYYAVGDGVLMHLRVATSEQPGGPFVDAGKRLTTEPFAIDAHVFVDTDGQRYLFYATDFLDHERVGTGTVVDRMRDPFTLEGKPVPVSRAKYDWQIFDPHRVERGGVRWHTVEGSFVLSRKGRYYQMFSGGNYQNKSYGVAYAFADRVMAVDSNDQSQEWQQVIDGEVVFPVLHTIPGEVAGPGHNSVVAGPDHRQLFCVYHVIKPQGPFERVMAIDRLEWVGDRLVVLGPTYQPQPAPIQAASLLTLPMQASGQGHWLQQTPKTLRFAGAGYGQVSFPIKPAPFLFQVYLRSDAESYGIALQLAGSDLLRMQVSPQYQHWKMKISGLGQEVLLPLVKDFQPDAYHLLQVEVNGRRIKVTLSGQTWLGLLPAQVESLILFAEGQQQRVVDFTAPDLVYGYQDDFYQEPGTLSDLGWECFPESGGACRLAQDHLLLEGPLRLTKDPYSKAY